MSEISVRKVFVSYYHEEDQEYKDRFIRMMGNYIVDKSVNTGDIIDSGLPLDEIRRRIRDDYIADASVTIVLIGKCTWQRKHVDWEISSSISKTRNNSRCGLLGILLPSHPDFRRGTPRANRIPQRLADNCNGNDPYASIHRWSGSPNEVNRARAWIHEAFLRKDGTPPNNRLVLFGDNRSGDCLRGWQS